MTKKCDALLSKVVVNEQDTKTTLSAFHAALKANPNIQSISINNCGIVRLSGRRKINLDYVKNAKGDLTPPELLRDAIVCVSKERAAR